MLYIQLQKSVEFQWTGEAQPYCYICSKPGPVYLVDVVVFKYLRWEAAVRFVDIDGIIYHHCMAILPFVLDVSLIYCLLTPILSYFDVKSMHFYL
jgi:hypothetical protein